MKLAIATALVLGLLGAARAEPVAFTYESPEVPLIVVPVMVNGQPFRFILDTGASGTIVSKQVAKKLKLARGGKAVALGATGSSAVYLSTIDSLEIGGVKLEKLEVAIDDMKAIGKADGIIGYNFLRAFRVTIDYKKQTIAFEP